MGYILITGGQLFNKGAQAMTFTVVNEIRKRYPEKKIILLSSLDFKRSKEDKEKYRFVIMPYEMRPKLALAGGIHSLINKVYKYGKYKKNSRIYEYKLREYFENAEMLIDISGYGFSSQWGFKKSFLYLLNIIIAKRFKIPVYILPQSLGPFNYSRMYEKFIIQMLMKKYLKYPKVIYSRENEGYEEIKKYSKNNIDKGLDIVLQSRDSIDLKNIYSHECLFENEKASKMDRAVCIVPNEKILLHGKEEQIYKVYYSIIECLLKHNKTVYLLRHSTEDMHICEKIKDGYTCEKNVILLTEEYSCVELQQLLSEFDFVIASRYHSVVHAYKEKVPTIVFGWAIKYKELLEVFSQGKYLFDVRQDFREKNIIETVNVMVKHFKDESNIIESNLRKVRDTNIFEKIFDRKD